MAFACAFVRSRSDVGRVGSRREVSRARSSRLRHSLWLTVHSVDNPSKTCAPESTANETSEIHFRSLGADMQRKGDVRRSGGEGFGPYRGFRRLPLRV
eukprot:scaffold1949_cov348-Pavlova_lutheri.AAC.24